MEQGCYLSSVVVPLLICLRWLFGNLFLPRHYNKAFINLCVHIPTLPIIMTITMYNLLHCWMLCASMFGWEEIGFCGKGIPTVVVVMVTGGRYCCEFPFITFTTTSSGWSMGRNGPLIWEFEVGCDWDLIMEGERFWLFNGCPVCWCCSN